MLQVAVRKQRGDFTLDAAFEVATPGVVALFGRSGCGKSTLVDIIAGLLQPDSGSVRLDGTEWVNVPAGTRLPAERRRIGYVFQDARLFPHLDVRANLLYGMKRTRASHTLLLDPIVELLGLTQLLTRRAHQLSGGERQRVALGRALLSQPQLLLLDEPLASLDAARRDEVLPYFEALRDHYAIPMVYVSHQFDEVLRLANHVVVMDAGKVAIQGDLDTVSRSAALRSIVGTDAIGAVLEARVLRTDADGGLAELQVGAGLLRVADSGFVPGAALRVQLLARDIILATREPTELSVRNSLAGIVRSIEPESSGSPASDLVEVDIGGACVLAHITRSATLALGLQPGTRVWALVKAVSTRGHTFAAAATTRT